MKPTSSLPLLSVLTVLAAAVPVFAIAASPVACTMEAKLCPDGATYVSREGPNCEFAACPSAFSDVPSNHPNAEAIAYVKAEGIVWGYPDETFRPDSKINRAEFVKIVDWATLGDQKMFSEVWKYPWALCSAGEAGVEAMKAVANAIHFSDVLVDDWFHYYVCIGKHAGFIDGYPDGTFRPAANINFVEAAKIISKSFNLPLTDGQDAWYENYVRALASNKAIPESITRFDQPITRGEMAEMIYRLKAGITDQPSKTYEDLHIFAQYEKGWKQYLDPDHTFTLSLPSNWIGNSPYDGRSVVIKELDGTVECYSDPQYEVLMCPDSWQGARDEKNGNQWFEIIRDTVSDKYYDLVLEEQNEEWKTYIFAHKESGKPPVLKYQYLFEKDDHVVILGISEKNTITERILESFRFLQ